MTPSLSSAVSGGSSLPYDFDVHALAMNLQVALATLEPLIHQASAPFHTPPGGALCQIIFLKSLGRA